MRWPELADQRDAGDRECRTEKASDDGKDEALRDQLSQDPPAAGADGETDRDLTLTRRSSRQQEVGDVRADDQQEDADSDGEHAKRRPARRDQLFFDRLRVETPHARRQRLREQARRRFGTQPLADGIGFLRRSLDRHAIAQASDDAAGEPSACRGVFGNWRPEINHRWGIVETRIHDADDREWRAVEKSGFRAERLQRDRTSDDGGVGLEVAAPRAGAEDDDAGPGPVVARVERAAEQGTAAEHAEGIGGHERAGQTGRARGGRHQGDRRRHRVGHGRQRGRTGAPVAEFGPRHAGPATGRRVRVARRQPFDDPDEPIAVRIRQRTQQHGVDHAEDGGGGADAERERDHGGRGEPGIASETARRVRHVAPHIVQPEERRSSHRCVIYITHMLLK